MRNRYQVEAKLTLFTSKRTEKEALMLLKRLEFDINKLLLTDAGTVVKVESVKTSKMPF